MKQLLSPLKTAALSIFKTVSYGALVPLALSACSSTGSGGSTLNKALELVGLQTIPAPVSTEMATDRLKPSRPSKIALRIHGGDQLNNETGQRPLALVLKIYKLNGHEEFIRAPYQAFTNDSGVKGEVISSREIVLLPGQRYEVEESLPKETTHLGVVALYKSPDPLRWRFVFDVASSLKAGITLGAHQCALSVSQGSVTGSPPEAHRLAGAVCR